LFKGSTQNFDDTNIIDVEVSRVFGEYGKDALGNQICEEVFVARLFGRNDRPNGLAEFLNRA
jgi:hypothetical protein